MNKQKIKAKIVKILQFLLNPRFLLCFGLAWLITNGWSYVLFTIGTFFKIEWMMWVSGAYLAFLWLPLSPEKLVTVAIAVFLLNRLFPEDEKTLAVLKNMRKSLKVKKEEIKKKIKYKKELTLMKENRFFVCEHCGNLIGMIHDAGVPMMCCGQKMTALEPGTAEAGVEKHLPVVTVEENKVKAVVGSAMHPMAEEHHISWVYLQTDKGGQRKCLNVSSEPVVEFALCNETPVAVYAYCNLHGLWRTEI